MNESGFFWRIPASKKQGRVRPTKPTIGPWPFFGNFLRQLPFTIDQQFLVSGYRILSHSVHIWSTNLEFTLTSPWLHRRSASCFVSSELALNTAGRGPNRPPLTRLFGTPFWGSWSLIPLIFLPNFHRDGFIRGFFALSLGFRLRCAKSSL
jgi:hypothetical protein